MKMINFGGVDVDIDSISSDDIEKLKDYFREKEQIKFVDRFKKLFSKKTVDEDLKEKWKIISKTMISSCSCGYEGNPLYSKSLITNFSENDEYYDFIKGKRICICPKCGVLKIK